MDIPLWVSLPIFALLSPLFYMLITNVIELYIEYIKPERLLKKSNCRYDNKGNVINIKESSFECKIKYDKNNRIKRYSDNKGVIYKYKKHENDIRIFIQLYKKRFYICERDDIVFIEIRNTHNKIIGGFSYYNHSNSDINTHAEGDDTIGDRYAHAEGFYTQALGYAHAEGYFTQALGYAHAEGSSTIVGEDHCADDSSALMEL